MNIYCVERTDSVWYDQYKGAVVIAENMERAYQMVKELVDNHGYGPKEFSLHAEYIGFSTQTEERFVLTSFKAG
jgi:hypothetical protein